MKKKVRLCSLVVWRNYIYNDEVLGERFAMKLRIIRPLGSCGYLYTFLFAVIRVGVVSAL